LMLIRLSVLTLLLASCASAPTRTPPRAELPAVELVTLEGQPTRLQQALEGKVALVAVWATWCEACAAEFEPLARLAERAGARGRDVALTSPPPARGAGEGRERGVPSQ